MRHDDSYQCRQAAFALKEQSIPAMTQDDPGKEKIYVPSASGNLAVTAALYSTRCTRNTNEM